MCFINYTRSRNLDVTAEIWVKAPRDGQYGFRSWTPTRNSGLQAVQRMGGGVLVLLNIDFVQFTRR